MADLASLQSLADIISAEVKKLVTQDPAALNGQSRKLVAAAASQLLTLVMPPEEHVVDLAGGVFMTSTLGFVIDAHIVDILAEAGPEVCWFYGVYQRSL
jgi:hypothetical protein